VTSLQFPAAHGVSAQVVLPLSSTGRIALLNASDGTVHLVLDVVGYLHGGSPTATGGVSALDPQRVLDTRSTRAIAAGTAVSVKVAGFRGVPVSNVAAVFATISSVAPSGSGSVIAYSGTRPSVADLQLAAGVPASDLAVIGVSTSGTITLFNNSGDALNIVVDVAGYMLRSDVAVPTASTSHYVRNIDATSDETTLQAEGAADAAAGSTFVVLDIGAQRNDKSGVQLTDGSTSLSYAQLVIALQGYLDGFGSVPGATVAVSTNNDAADWTGYLASARGADWANKVVDLLSPQAGVAVVGADDIEPDFFSTEPQAEQWEAAYLGAATTKKLIFIGSADGCPTTYGATGGTCNGGWTEANLNKLAGGPDPTHIKALPQIYTPAQAIQWANIYATGGHAISFAGALTENAACPTASSPGCTFAALIPMHGWAALYDALASVVATPQLPAVTDLRIDD
jgi:hypothetical protein